MAGQIDSLKILQEHLVKTGFQDKYNELVDIVIFGVENDNNGNLVFTTNTGTIIVPIPFDLDSLQGVNVSGATSGQVLSFNGSNWEGITIVTSDDLLYIRPTQSTRVGFEDIDNITSVTDALDKLLYPFVVPTFSTFFITGKSNTIELGDYLIGSTAGNETVTFNWGVTEIANISAVVGYDIIDVTDSNANLKTNILPNTTTDTLITVDALVNNINGATQVYKIEGTDIEAGNFTKTKTHTWRPRRFWGTDPSSGPLNSAEIIALESSNTGGSELSGSRLQTRSMDGNNQYIYICWLESLGDTNGFIVGNLPNSAWTKEVVSFTNTYGHTENYITYRTNTIQFGTGINIEVT